MASCTSETEPMSSASASSAATASSTSCSAIASGCSTARMASPIAAAIAEPETGAATQQRHRRQRNRVRETGVDTVDATRARQRKTSGHVRRTHRQMYTNTPKMVLNACFPHEPGISAPAYTCAYP